MTHAALDPVGRSRWVDAAKGLSIVLVVLFHATLVDGQPPDTGPWWVVNAVFATLRMPLFFLVSGLFAASALRRSWADLLRGRVLQLVYVYVLWLTVRELYFAGLGRGLDLSWQAYVLPDSDMWFLYVLAIFFVVARALRSVSASVQTGVAAISSIVIGSFTFEREMHRFDDMAVYFVFFVAGCSWSRAIRHTADAVTMTTTSLCVLLFVLVTGLVTVLDLRDVPPFRFLMSAVALAAGVSFAVVVVRMPLGASLTHLGRNSLPVYVLHMLFITTATRLDARLGVDLQELVVGPVLLATLGIGGSLAAHRLLARVPGLSCPQGGCDEHSVGTTRGGRAASVTRACTLGRPDTRA